MDALRRRSQRLISYQELRSERPSLFENPPNAAYEILFEVDDQHFVADQSAQWCREHDLPEAFGDIGVVYRDPYIIVVRDAVRFRSGERGAYVRILGAEMATGTAILATLPGQRFILMRHFRHATRTWHWEIPRGFGSSDLSPESTVAKELKEELNAQVRHLEFLGHLNNDSGTVAGVDRLYWAELQETASSPGLETSAEEEGIDEIQILSHDDFAALIRSGVITDAYALSAYCLAVAKGLVDAPRSVTLTGTD